MQDIQQARAKAELAQQQAAEAKAISDFYQEFPQLALTANTNLLRGFLNGQPITLDSLREAAEFLADRLAVKDDGRLEKEASQARAALESEYEDLLPGSPEMKAELMSRVKYKSDAELAQLIYQRKVEIDLRQHTAQEIRTALRPDHTPKFPELPAEFTASAIKKLPVAKLRALLRVFGQSQVDARLAS